MSAHPAPSATPSAPDAPGSGERARVAVLFGGRSSEHGISCVTAGGILGAIDRERYEVIALGITRTGTIRLVSDRPEDWRIVDGAAPEVPDEGEEVLWPKAVAGPGERPVLRRIGEDGRIAELAPIDAVLPLLHGPYGEDGTIQGLMELLDLPYAGNGLLASAACMDKATTKALLRDADLACAPGFAVHEDEWASQARPITDRAARELRLPWFVKPTRAGSSVGVTKVDDPAELEHAVKTAFREDPRILIEQGVAGREVECGVLQGRDGAAPRTTLPGEVKVGDDLDFYDYESKYFGKGTVNIEVPAALTEEQTDAVRETAARAFTALGLEGLARVDVFVTDSGITINEVNTLPGFTPFSMFPVLWAEMGMSYADLLTELIELARARRVGLR